MKARISDGVGHVIHAAVEAARWAPSLHNTQPWSLTAADGEITLHADPHRQLRVADETGREMLIGCGAALFNVRVALRALGYEPEVRLLPDPASPSLLATIRPRADAGADDQARWLREEIERRRTHRAGFSGVRVPERLIEALIAQAGVEGAHLIQSGSGAAVRVLAEITNAAQRIQSGNRLFGLEMGRWSRPPGSVRPDGVPARSYPRMPRRTSPHHFAQREYARGHQWGSEDETWSASDTGVVAVLTTPGDSRADWLAGGQALQRVLLHASAHGVRAAFHTQGLEIADLREFVRRHVCSGEFPQMIMRLGFVMEWTGVVRRSSAGLWKRA